MGEPRSNVEEKKKTQDLIDTMWKDLDEMKTIDRDKLVCQHRARKRHDQGIMNKLIRQSTKVSTNSGSTKTTFQEESSESDFEIEERYFDSHLKKGVTIRN